ncbi:MAG: class I mannose-6-phosphate isomerase [Lachnospiraceae bacterium]|nr:class I mannose-6-phosphate isomerase [Lachnospiraceae bacterium]
MELIFLKPVFKEMIWGGNKLKEFGYDIPGDDTGECWAISAHPNGDCLIKDGEFNGKTLSWLWENHKELFGNSEGDRYPLLIKIIDAKDDLSIQVHPDDNYAKANENGSFGKTECWYILDCEPGTKIVIGHNAKDHAELENMIRNARWSEFIREIPVHKGDFFQIDPGTLHAIKGGTLILETQQNSDVTYRVYDYDRLQNGKPRQLHVQQSIDVIKAPFEENANAKPVVSDLGGCVITRFVKCPYYTVEKIELKDSQISFDMEDPFINMSVVEGNGNINGINIKKGDHFIIPSGYGEYTLDGNMTIIRSFVEN